VAAFMTGIAISFLLQKYFTFNDYTRHNIRRQTILYLGLHTFNLGLNTLLMYVGVDLLEIPYLISQALIVALLAISNFFTSKHLVFTPDAPYNKER
jgi:putative flippase GtrA